MNTAHSLTRMQQRGIPPLVIDWLLDYGRERHDHHGAVIHYFDRQSRRALEHAAGSRVVARLSDYLDCYAVRTVGGNLITVGHRHKRFRLN